MTPVKIKQARATAGLTQNEASDLIGVSIRAWIKWESSERKIPNPAWRLFLLLTDQDDEFRLTKRKA